MASYSGADAPVLEIAMTPRVPILLFASLLAMCGCSDDTGRVRASGDTTTGPVQPVDGGVDASERPPPIADPAECGLSSVVYLPADGLPSGDVEGGWIYHGAPGLVDTHRAGECEPIRDEPANGLTDLVVRFTAPANGHYWVSTRGSRVDTLLSHVRHCAERQAVLECDAGASPDSTWGELVIFALEGQTVDLVVAASGPEALRVDDDESLLTVAVQPIGAWSPCVADTPVARYDAVSGRLGVLGLAHDFNRDIERFELSADVPLALDARRVSGRFDAHPDAELLWSPPEADREPRPGDGADSEATACGPEIGDEARFEIQTVLPLESQAVDVVRLALFDRLGLSSTLVEIPVEATPIVEADAPCDVQHVLGRCGDAGASRLICRARPEHSSSPEGLEGVCIEATTPFVEQAQVGLRAIASNDDEPGRLAVTVWLNGADPDGDIREVLLKTANDVTPIPLTTIGDGMTLEDVQPHIRLPVAYSTALGDHQWRLLAFDPSPPLDAACQFVANEVFRSCLSGETPEPEPAEHPDAPPPCVRAAEHARRACHDNPSVLVEPANGAFINRVTVEVIDSVGLRSDAVDAELILEPSAIENGSPCDPVGAVTTCPDGLACARPVVAPVPVCFDPDTPCPAEWSTSVLEPTRCSEGSQCEPQDEVWAMAGHTGHAGIDAGGGTCGGGRQAAAHVFVAPVAGEYEARVVQATNTDGPVADPVLYVRSSCALAEPAFELACNDDQEPGANLLPRVSFTLDGGDRAYLFVDGYRGRFAGSYRLEVRLSER